MLFYDRNFLLHGIFLCLLSNRTGIELPQNIVLYQKKSLSLKNAPKLTLGCIVSNCGTQASKKVYQQISIHFKISMNIQKWTLYQWSCFYCINSSKFPYTLIAVIFETSEFLNILFLFIMFLILNFLTHIYYF